MVGPPSFLLLCVFMSSSATDLPGFKIRVTDGGLSFVTEKVKKEVENLPKSKYRNLPDQHGSTSGMSYSVTGLCITYAKMAYFSIQPMRTGELFVSIKGTSVQIHGNWQLDNIASGTLDVIVSSLWLKGSIRVGYDGTSRPTIHADSSSCQIGLRYIKVHLDGGPRWIIDKFHIEDKIQNDLTDTLKTEACPEFVTFINKNAANKLRSLKVLYPITKYSELDIGLTSNPLLNGSVTTDHKGAVYQNGNHTKPPFTVPPIPVCEDESNMLIIWVTDYVANSACYVLHSTNYFQYNLTQEKIPADVNLNLNTSLFPMTVLIPQLSKIYPNKLMQINVNTTAPPRVTFGLDKVSINVTGDVVVYVIKSSDQLTYLFTLGSTLNITAKLGTSGTNVTWHDVSICFDVQLLNTTITFKIESLRAALKIALKTYIMPLVKKKGLDGISFPIVPLFGHQFSFQNTTIKQRQNFLMLGADIYGITG